MSKKLEEIKAELPKKVDVVILHKFAAMADSLAGLVNKREKTADVYYTGEDFLKHFEQYPKSTKICFNYDLEKGLTGKDIAIRLHNAGYTNFFLFTGWDQDSLDSFDLPDYLSVVFNYGLTVNEIIDILCT